MRRCEVPLGAEAKEQQGEPQMEESVVDTDVHSTVIGAKATIPAEEGGAATTADSYVPPRRKLEPWQQLDYNTLVQELELRDNRRDHSPAEVEE